MASHGDMLKVGDRVMWPSDHGNELGSVRWIGTLPDDAAEDITAGVEFDNPVGTGTGKYRDCRLFNAKPNHASLIPLMGLMRVGPQDDAPPPYSDNFHDITKSSPPPAENSPQFGQGEKLPQESPPPYASSKGVIVNSAYAPSQPSLTTQPQSQRYQQQTGTRPQNQYAPTQSGCCDCGDDCCNICMCLCCCAVCECSD